MDWKEARQLIRDNVTVGTDVNTLKSKFRFIESADVLLTNQSYGYRNHGWRGFRVKIGRNQTIQVPWDMLETCFTQLSTAVGYDGKFFRSKYPRQACDHPCHVHVIGRILVKAGVGKPFNNQYVMRT